MEQRVFQHVPLDTLQAFRDEGYRQSVELINQYIVDILPSLKGLGFSGSSEGCRNRFPSYAL